MGFEEVEDLWTDGSFSWCDSGVLQDGMDYAVSGGKRIRPLLCLKMCEALGGDAEEARIFGRAIESLHNATLVHDDIQDGDRYRRGEEAVWTRYGMAQGINVGDALLAQGYHIILEEQDRFEDGALRRLLELYNRAERTLVDGQAMDLSFRERDDISEEEYMEMTRKKTGALLTAAMQGAVAIADGDDALMDSIESFGEVLGPAFQIRDDVIDLVGEKGRQRQGNDIREGKRSLIVVKALNRLEGDDREELLTVLDREREEITDADVETAVDILTSVNAVEDANTVAEHLASEGKEVLEEMNASCPMQDVLDLTDFVVERTF